MNVLIVIGFVAIAGIALSGILISIQDNQDLVQINNEIAQNQHDAMSVSSSVSGSVNNGKIIFKNSLNDDVEIIQIRVYDDDGDFVESFTVDNDIPGNTELEFENLPDQLKIFLGDETQ